MMLYEDTFNHDRISMSNFQEEVSPRSRNDMPPRDKEGVGIDTLIKEMVKTRHDHDMITNGIEDYPSFSDLDRKIHVNGAYNSRISSMIVIEDMDRYRNEAMGDVIVRKEFCKEINVKAK
nr:hypothetical protein [Tanacetum cinerariifolium]